MPADPIDGIPYGIGDGTDAIPEASADAIRAAHGPPDERDLADGAEHGARLQQFGAGLSELLDQIAVAGLAHPDPDWVPAAAELLDRARRLGLGSAAEALAELGRALDAVRRSAPPGILAPAPLTRAAWHALQRLVAWRRLFGRAVALQRVEGQLAAEALVARGERPPRSGPPTASARVWPLGLSLRDDQLTVLGIDLDTGGVVRVRDRLSEHDPDDPLAGTVISRLFQARISLRAALDGLIVFEDHPVGRARGGPLFAPAFRTMPKRVDADPSARPAGRGLPRATAETAADVRRPMVADLVIERGREGLHLRLAGGPDTPLEIERTAVLDLNLLGRLIERSTPDQPAVTAPLTVVLGPGSSGARVLSARDDHGGRIFVAHDPRCFTLSPAALIRRARVAAEGMADPIAARFVRTIAGLFGGRTADATGALVEQWRGPVPGIDRLFRAVLAGRLLGSVGDPARDAAVERAIDDCVLLGALSASSLRPVDRQRLLGGPPGAGPLPGRVIFRALWLLFTGDPDGVRARRGALLTLFAARYAEPPPDADAHDVAARALLLAELSREAAEADEDHGEAPLTADEILDPARQYLDAHLADLRPAPGRPAAPLPEFDGLWALAEDHRLLHPDAPRRGMPALGLHRPTLAIAAAAALLDLHNRPLRAVDGLLCAAAAGIEDWLVGPGPDG